MEIRFPDLYNDILALKVGQSKTYTVISGRTMKQMLGDIQYFFTGHVEPGDERIGKHKHITRDWDWRADVHYIRTGDNIWELTVTKIPAPIEQMYSGKVGAVVREVETLSQKLEQARSKLDNLKG